LKPARVSACKARTASPKSGQYPQITISSDKNAGLLARLYAGRHSLKLRAWCLMSNHVHLVAIPERPDSLRHSLARTHTDYARSLNIKRRSCGHVWQARSPAFLVKESLLAVIPPLRNMTSDLGDYNTGLAWHAMPVPQIRKNSRI
jgi:hypothetical protein